MHRTGSGRTEASSGATDERRAGASTSSSGGSSSSAPAEALAREVTDRQYGHDVVPELADRRAEPSAIGRIRLAMTMSQPRAWTRVTQRPGASAYERQLGGPCCNDTLSGAAPAGGLSAFGVV